MAYVWNTPTSQNMLQGLQGFLPSSLQTPSIATPNPTEVPVGYSPTNNFSLGMNGYAQGTAPFQFSANTSPTFTGLQDVQGLSDNAFAGNTGLAFQPLDWKSLNAQGAQKGWDEWKAEKDLLGGAGGSVAGGAGDTDISSDFFSWDRAMGTEGQAGWAPTAFQGVQALGGVYSAIQGAKAAKNLLNFQKKAYRQNYNQQAQTLNTAMQDRQAARRSYSSQYQDVDSYMQQHALKSI